MFPGTGETHGFTLKDGAWSKIDYPRSKITIATGINSRGEIIGTWAGKDRNEHSFFVTGGRFESIDVPGSVRTIADAILDSGTVVGTFTDNNGAHRGFIMSGVGIEGKIRSVKTVDIPGLTVVRGINARGDLAGRFVDSKGKEHGYVICSGLGRSQHQ